MRAKKVDANQKKIVMLCRCIPGLTLAHTHIIGKGFPDFLIGFKNNNYLIELKDGAKVKSKKKLTPDEKKFHSEWKGQIAVIENFDEILTLLKLQG